MIIVSLVERCPDFRGLNVCICIPIVQMGPWTSVLIKVCI